MNNSDEDPDFAIPDPVDRDPLVEGWNPESDSSKDGGKDDGS